jgi:arylsulfatase A-like enzyme/Tfp pilus assembly protein PilF
VRRRLAAFGLVALGAAGVVLWWRECGGPAPGGRALRRGAPPRNLLLITLDTTRADRLSAYGGPAQVPNLERLAREGVRFERAFSPAPLTLPAHASLFTGLYPSAHGVRTNGGLRLGDEAVTLAEILRHQGFRTAAIIGSQILDSRFGLDQGFELYDDTLPPEERVRTYYAERPAEEVAERALAWLEERGRERWFLWVHFFDPHFEYRPPEPHRSRHPDSPYDGEIAYVDAQAGRVLDLLRRRGRLDETLVVAAGDHGEGLGDHGEKTHGVFVYDSTMRVPLLMRHPASLEEGGRVESLVRLVDLFPTVLDLLRAPLPSRALHGETLVPLLAAGAAAPPRAAWLESWQPRLNFGWSELVAVRDERWKYIRAPRSELYDLGADPGETRNLAARETGRAEEYRAALSAMEASLRPGAASGLARALEMDAEMREALAALGYLSVRGPGSETDTTPDGTTLPDPKDKIGEYEEMAQAFFLLRRGRAAEALPLIERSIAANPRSAVLRHRLGNAYRALGRHRQAIESLRRALDLDPASIACLTDLGAAFLEAGELGSAEETFVRVTRLNPRAAEAYSNLALIEMKRGRREAAARLYERSLEEDPNLLRSLVNLGSLYEQVGRGAEAIPLYLRVAELEPENPRAYFSAGYLLTQAGRYDEALEVLERARKALPRSAAPAVYKARVHRRRGDLDSAEREARSALALEPSSAEARRILDAIEAERRRRGAHTP